MLADPLTKGMPPQKFKDHLVTMGLSPSIQNFIVTMNVYETLFYMIFLVNCVHIQFYFQKCR